ncbi:MAG: hypothetical protein GVY22_06790 [Gammaproteobacteria bacterium]|jgi:hypothetical protein|nr:hypothetical protein [Gammaproteobacteria bacterium]
MSQTKPTSNVTVKVDTQIVSLVPGLYLFRYASDIPEGQQVPATLQAAPVGEGNVDFFPGVNVLGNTLRQLGDCVVVRVARAEAGVLIAKYRVPGHSASGPVQIQVDFVDNSGRFVRSQNSAPGGVKLPAEQGGGAALSSNASASGPSAGIRREKIELHGHVERLGDVSAGDGWLGDPGGAQRVEGFAVHWYDQPPEVSLSYRCYVEGLGESPQVASGGFVGTRRRGAAITAVTFGLAGPHAANYDIAGQVRFSNGGLQPVVGGQKLSGPNGTEHLCALRLEIVRREHSATEMRAASPWDDPSATQIFRSRSR